MCLYFIIIQLTFTVLFFRKFHCFTVCIEDETLISKRLNKDGPFTYRLRFNLHNYITDKNNRKCCRKIFLQFLECNCILIKLNILFGIKCVVTSSTGD